MVECRDEKSKFNSAYDATVQTARVAAQDLIPIGVGGAWDYALMHTKQCI